MLRKLKEKFVGSPFYRIETLVIVAALLFGFIGAYLQLAREKAYHASIREQFKTVQVLVAIKKLGKGHVLKNKDIDVVSILKDRITNNMLISRKIDHALGRSLKIDVLAGDVLNYSMLKDLHENESFAQKIPIGERLFTLSVQSNPGPAGKISPGDHVDIVAEMTFKGKGRTVYTLLADRIVTAVGDVTDPSKKIEASEISFWVKPEELERLQFAQTQGVFYVSLRNPYDKSKRENTKGTSQGNFILSDNVYQAAEPSVKISVKK